jgi:hypothetical protein
MLDFWHRPPCVRRTVIVNLKDRDDEAFRGVLWRVAGAWLVLKQTEILQPQQPPRSLDGEVLVHRSNVSFLQVEP